MRQMCDNEMKYYRRSTPDAAKKQSDAHVRGITRCSRRSRGIQYEFYSKAGCEEVVDDDEPLTYNCCEGQHS